LAQRRQFQPDGLPDAAADAVSLDGLAQRAWRGEADAALSGHCEIKSGKQGTRVPRTLIIGFSEIAGAE
jgi:hypothetical protein